MKKGVIAFIDFLGTKGIWEKYEAKDVIEKLKHLRDNVLKQHLAHGESYLEDVSKKGGPSIKTNAIFVSDTIAIAFWYDSAEDENLTPGALVYIVGKVVAEFIREAASTDLLPSRIFRGCITVGEFDYDESFLIGPAVDEAGAYHEQADGALVFIVPSAAKYLNEAIDYLRHLVKTGESTREEACKSIEALLFIPHEIQLKKAGNTVLPVLNPLAGESVEDQKNITQAILSAFDDPDPRVAKKRQNTEQFLGKCSTFSIEPWF